MIIGIAGYTGSGKSTCARMLCGEGCAIIDGDAEGKRVMQSDPAIKGELAETFGSEVIGDDGIRFEILSDKVFRDLRSLVALNAIVHPRLLTVVKESINRSSAKRVILDAALIPLWEIESWFDTCVWIDTPFQLRLQRLREKYPQKNDLDLRLRMDMQTRIFSPPEGSGWITIDNSKDLDNLKKHTMEIDFSGQKQRKD